MQPIFTIFKNNKNNLFYNLLDYKGCDDYVSSQIVEVMKWIEKELNNK